MPFDKDNSGEESERFVDEFEMIYDPESRDWEKIFILLIGVIMCIAFIAILFIPY